jgi:hypothetical protein
LSNFDEAIICFKPGQSPVGVIYPGEQDQETVYRKQLPGIIKTGCLFFLVKRCKQGAASAQSVHAKMQNRQDGKKPAFNKKAG